ncbi:M61 family metallopeptidase [Aurantibacillus circumpalustris]|uniref:M61 family metallopeptidase n=1 Tax=Aurantibacillus circumpalustris TaxID=3036359 RepID=UPI00295BE866|nr:peptidase M61 [Aurantibacillus circumpalustris]
MKKIVLGVLLLCGSSLLADETYHYFINLTKVNNDRVSVVLTPPDLKQDEIEFMFPAMVPGTYEVYDFGRFISNFKVSGKSGVEIKVTKVDVNTYKISPASKIDKITYDVDDTFDKTDLPNTKEKIIFEPGGTNFEENKNFSINTHSMFGYIKGLADRNFVLEFEKPKGFYPSTGLSDIKIGESKDVLSVFDYHDLADSPIMYFVPDTSTILVGNTNVLISCYSPNKFITSNYIASTLKELLYAQRDYLGGELPVNKYAFLFYFIDRPTLSGSHGALEHSYSSFYVMPEYDSTSLQQNIRDVSAHEFFHIVTPLNIHAKEIGDFDFNDPKMSEHLWLYEGMTEYAAHHAQVKAGLIDINQYMSVMMQKYENSIEGYNDTMSFTYMSKHVLEEKIHTQYANVYEKGAVIGMCLDILLRDLSNGEYGTQNLMKDLATKYGKNKSFNDADLFNDIEKFTYPEVGEFLRKHVGGKTPLPMADILGRVAIEFANETVLYEFTLGNPDLNYNETTRRLFIENASDLDEFGKALGLKKGDELYKLNGIEIKIEEVKEVIGDYYNKVKEGDNVTIEIYRPKALNKKKYKQKSVSASARKIKIVRKNQIGLMKDATDKQKATLKSWVPF